MRFFLHIRSLISAAGFLMLTACANIVAPSGGPADREPPVFIRSVPDDRAVNFSGTKLTLTFNEFVQLHDAANQVVISPLLKEIPEYRTRGKSVIVMFREPLKDNTTYTVHFGNSVRDITEGNELQDFSFAFSTGSFTDSLTLTGSVKNAFTLLPEKDVLVMLYATDYDSIPYTERPDHIARTNAAGMFRMENLPHGSFKLFALRDANNNYLYDLLTEPLAFSVEPAEPYYIPDAAPPTKSDSLRSDTAAAIVIPQPLMLYLFEETDTTQRILKEITNNPGRFQLIFKYPARDIGFRFLKKPVSGDWHIMEFNEKRDTLTCWVTDLTIDSLFIEVNDNRLVLDTFAFRVSSVHDTLRQQRGRGGKASARAHDNKLTFSSPAATSKRHDFHRELLITTSHPVKESDLSRIELYEIHDSLKTPAEAAVYFSDTGIMRNLIIDHVWKQKTGYEIFIPPATFTDIFGLANDSLTLEFITTTREDYGILQINFSNIPEAPQYIFHLLDGNKNIVREIIFSEPAAEKRFEFLKPGSYSARIILDRNGNGKWDSGRYLQRLQPETVINCPSPMNVRANWDTEIDWKF
jgi:hypothetical protein